ncbi:MAG: CDGSH iron-sulfur domain-containing protein [Sporichthyaceae bacterium]
MGRPAGPVRVRVDPRGPIYLDGPVEVSADGCEAELVERFRVAICACRRSARYPLCDGSHQTARGDDDR